MEPRVKTLIKIILAYCLITTGAFASYNKSLSKTISAQLENDYQKLLKNPNKTPQQVQDFQEYKKQLTEAASKLENNQITYDEFEVITKTTRHLIGKKDESFSLIDTHGNGLRQALDLLQKSKIELQEEQCKLPLSQIFLESVFEIHDSSHNVKL